MASSGSFSTNAHTGSSGTRFLTFSWKEVSQNIAANTTTISWELKGDGTSTQWFALRDVKLVIAGETVYTVGGDYYNFIKLDQGTVVSSGTHTFTHNADGTKSFSVSMEAAIYVYTVNVSGSTTFTLDTIARASQPSLVTWPNTTNNVGDFGETFSIHMNRKSESFTHTVRYEYGNRTGTIATNVTTGTTWAVPLSFMNDIPSSTSASGRIYVDTYNGSTLVGTKYTGFTVTVPASVKPTCTMTLEDITGVDDIYGSPVKGLSKIKVTVSATKAYSSEIKSYTIQINGATYYAATATSGLLNNSGSVPVTVTVKDARGRTGSASYNMSVQDYNAPAVTKLTAVRCNEDGTVNKRGSFIKVTFSAVVSSMSGKNTSGYKLKYKKTSETTYTAVTFPALANNFAPSNQTYIFAAAISNSYDVVIEAIDRHNANNPSDRSVKAPTASAIFSWRGFTTSSGKEEGAGIGKVPEKPNTLQVGWKTEFEQDVFVNNAHAIYAPQGLYDTRTANETPEWYMTKYRGGVVWEFKELASIQFTNPAASYAPLKTIIPWFDSSGGLPRQIVYENKTRWIRQATSATTWGAWESDLLRAYPVGSVYSSSVSTSPAQLFGGTWTQLASVDAYADNDWVNGGNGVVYRRQSGLVTVRGYSQSLSLTAKTYTTLCTLPEGYRPKCTIPFAVQYQGGQMDGQAAYVEQSGIVRVYPPVTTAYWGFSVTFPVDYSSQCVYRWRRTA